jgi:hypothetical protein
MHGSSQLSIIINQKIKRMCKITIKYKNHIIAQFVCPQESYSQMNHQKLNRNSIDILREKLIRLGILADRPKYIWITINKNKQKKTTANC